MQSEWRLDSVRIMVLCLNNAMFRWWVSGMDNCKVQKCLEGVWIMAVGRGRLVNGKTQLYIQIQCFSNHPLLID